MNKKIPTIIVGVTLLFTPLATAFAEVPFEVVKTYVTAEASDTSFAGIDTVAIDEVLYDDASEGEKFGYPPPEGEYDQRVKIPVEAVHYKIEFWNVGEMGGEKGFIFKSSYGKAKLTRTYELGQAHKNVPGKEEFMGLHSMETKEVSTPNVKTTFIDELTFSGGPYGKFYYTANDGGKYQIAHVSEGKYIVFDNVPENTNPKKPRYLMTLGYAMNIHPYITNSSAFKKWMELLDGDCTDTGIRFSDYNGEVMLRPDDDEDAWFGAELDMVLCQDFHVKTGDDSTAVLSLADMTTFVMKSDSEIILSMPSKKDNKWKLIYGKVKANFKEMIKDGTMTVEMSEAVAGIKGTTFVVEDDGTHSSLKVIEGHVEFTSNNTGASEMVGPGEMMTATEIGLNEKTTFDTEKENQTWKKAEDHRPQENDQDDGSGVTKPLVAIIVLLGLIGGYFFFIKKKSK